MYISRFKITKETNLLASEHSISNFVLEEVSDFATPLPKQTNKTTTKHKNSDSL